MTMTQLTFTDMKHSNRKKKTRKEEFFNQMEKVILWESHTPGMK
jgi:hypothetical protein